jgi:hypothetical protein
LPEDIHKISSCRIQHLELFSTQVAVAERIWILRHCNDSLVFAEEKPVPDALTVRDISASVGFVILLVLGWLGTNVV